MAGEPPDARPEPTSLAEQTGQGTEQVLPVYAERLAISRRRVETAVVQAKLSTRSREQRVDEELHHERVEVECVPIGRTVDSVPPVRQEGDTTILSVVEEVVVVERRLVLKEEVHVRRVKATGHHRETVTLREQEATVTRTALEPKTSAGASRSDTLVPNQLTDKEAVR